MAQANPQPGEVFREYIYRTPNGFFTASVIEGDKQETRVPALKDKAPQIISNVDLNRAVRAEVAVEYWGGHIGTTSQQFRVNGHEWIDVPQPATPTAPYAYYRNLMGNPAAAVPLAQLAPGENTFDFITGPQLTKYNFDWPFCWIYSFTLRVYYEKSRPHVEGELISPKVGSVIRENPELKIVLNRRRARAVRQVDYIGCYEDFDWEGDGAFVKWHFQLAQGEWQRHIGTANKAPFNVTWNTEWLPDQPGPIRIMARVLEENGMAYMTPAREDIAFSREGRSVTMFKPSQVPENFGVRVGRREKCVINVNESLKNAKRAKLALSTWSADHADQLALNGREIAKKIGRVHNFSYDMLDVPLDVIREGQNELSIYATTEEHAAEINWPGPVLLVEY